MLEPACSLGTQKAHRKLVERAIDFSQFFNASMNIATDVAIAILPLPLIKSLNLPKRSRVALIMVFSLGGM